MDRYVSFSVLSVSQLLANDLLHLLICLIRLMKFVFMRYMFVLMCTTNILGGLFGALPRSCSRCSI